MKKVRFKQKRDDCLMSWTFSEDQWERKRKYFENRNFIDIFLKELKILMKYQWRHVLSSVTVEVTKRDCSRLHDMLTKIRCLQTEKLIFPETDTIQVYKFLRFFDSKILDKIHIKGFFLEMDTVKFKRITELEQWRNAKCVVIEASNLVPQFHDFLHFSEVKIDCGSVPVQDIIRTKEQFLTSSTLSVFDIQYYSDFYDRQHFEASFGNPSPSFAQSDFIAIWFFRIPNSEEVLSFTFYTCLDHCVFRRIKIEDVPVGAVIKE